GTSNFGGYSLKVTGGSLLAYNSGSVGIGTAGPDAKLDSLATTEQLRLTYTDGSVYTSFTTDSGGDLTIAPTGSDINVTGNVTTTGDLAVNGDDITSDGTLTIDAATDLVLDADGADVFLKDAGVTFATFTNSTTDLTLDVAGGQLYLANGDTINIGGVTGLAYNAISDVGTTSHGLATDNDLYIEGDAEVDGVLYADGGITATGTVSATDFTCTDCLDFTDLEDTLDLDAAMTLNQSTNTWTQNFTGTTTDGLTYNGNSLTSGNLFKLSSTSTSFSSGAFISADWSPGSTTTNTGDLFAINTGTNGNLSGKYINLKKGGSSLFSIAGGNGNVSTEGDIAINGGDITGSGSLNIDTTGDNVTSPDKFTIGSSTAGAGQLTVTGKQTGKALAIFNETGDQNIFVASAAGTGVWSIGNKGDISRLESSAINGLPDQGSIAPNGSFELDNDGNSFPDGWTDGVGTATYTTTGGGHGERYMTIASGGTKYIRSSCIPISANQTYNLSIRAQGASQAIIQIDQFATRANCEAISTSLGQVGFIGINTAAAWAGLGNNTLTATAATARWGKIWIKNSSGTNNLDVDGLRVAPSALSTGLDLAETYPAATKDKLQTGEIVAMGTSNKQTDADINDIKRTTKAYDNLAFGVIATKPGIILDDEKSYEKVNVALKGRVPVLVTTENGPIHIGDAITSSSKPGVGMKATKSGRILGYAMTEWTNPDPNEIDQVTIFVNPGYGDGIEMNNATGSASFSTTPLSDELYNGVIDRQASAEASLQSILSSTSLSIGGRVIDSVKQFGSVITASMQTGLLLAKSVIVEGRLLANDILAGSIQSKTIATTSLQAETISSGTLTAQEITSDKTTTKSLIASDSITSKKITADTVDAGNIREIQEHLQRVSDDQTQTASSAGELAYNFGNLTGNINDIQKELSNIKSSQLPNPTYYQPVSGTSLESLTVSNAINTYDLFVGHSASIGNVLIQDDSLASLGSSLKLSALDSIDLMDGNVIIARDGTITTKGQLIAERGIKTNEFKALHKGDSIDVVLESGVDPVTQESRTGSLAIKNDQGLQVASIDASGSANFNSLNLDTAPQYNSIIAASDNLALHGEFVPALETNAKSAGAGVLPGNSRAIMIYNEKITDKSLIYITPTSNTYNKSVYVESKNICSSPSPSGVTCKKSFKVALDSPISSDIQFNWWIIN
ncbi:MAG: hypothetical protein ACMG6E_00200, partial [Candidatus Roizmanbacteria bacterium]